MMLARLVAAVAVAVIAAGGAGRAAAVADSLEELPLSQLRKRASETDGVREQQLDSALDSADPRASMIELVRGATAREQAPPEADLETLSLSQLRKQAAALGVEKSRLDQALDAHSPRTALIELLAEANGKAGSGGSAAEPGSSPAQLAGKMILGSLIGWLLAALGHKNGLSMKTVKNLLKKAVKMKKAAKAARAAGAAKAQNSQKQGGAKARTAQKQRERKKLQKQRKRAAAKTQSAGPQRTPSPEHTNKGPVPVDLRPLTEDSK